jgi:polysaccharide chain length determinant protein (PEP-CTERM system associated)
MAIRKYSLGEIADVLIRRRWIILVPLALGALLVPTLAKVAPKRYRSDALILVVPQQVPDDYVKPTISESVAQRLPAITAQILSRSRLEVIVQDLNLYPQQRKTWVMEDVVDRMRADVTTTPATGRSVNSFRISYLSDNPETARQVTERLARLYIDQNSTDRTNQANSTSEFLDAQLAEAKQRLIEQEKRLEEYRKAYSGQLPSQLQGNLQAVQSASLQLQALNEANNRAMERRLFLEHQIADARATPLPQSVTTTTAADAPAALSAAQQLNLAQARLTLLLQRNTETHPDVVNLRRLIEDLKVRVANETPADQTGQTDAADSVTTSAAPLPTPAEIAQQKRIQGFEAEMASIDFQLNANRAEQERLKQKISDYQAKVDAMPTRESELTELTRDYGTMQSAYASLLMKRQDSVIAANLERRRIGEQFQLVDAASRPERPDNQRQRLGVMAAGPAAGLLLGLLLVGVLELRDTSFRGPEEVMQTLSLPVLASIPMMNSARERSARTRRQRLMDLGGAVVVLGVIAVLVWWRLHTVGA